MKNEKKLCLLYNFSPHYREEIFTKMRDTFGCYFAFGDNILASSVGKIKSLDKEKLGNNTTLKVRKFFKDPFYWQCSMLSFLRKDYQRYMMIGEPHNVSSWLFLILSKFYSKKKVFLWTHGWYGKEGFFKKIVKKAYFGLADGILPYGNYAKELMIKEGIPAKKIEVIYNSLHYSKQIEMRHKLEENDIYQKYFSNTNKNLFYIGRLIKKKSLDFILKSLAILKNRGEEYNFMFIGDGPEREYLEALTKELGLSNNVHFLGACFDDDLVSSLIYNADLCISPGNVGLTAMDSLVYGCPLITHSDFPYQSPEFEVIKEGETGSFFEHNNIDSLADSISNWFKLNFDRATIRKNCFNEIDTNWNPNNQIEVIKNFVMKD